MFTTLAGKYNKWRNASEIIDIPEVYLEASAEVRELFFTNFSHCN